MAFSPSEHIRRRLGLYWGVTPRVMSPLRDTDVLIAAVQTHLVGGGFVTQGDRFVLVYGAPIAMKGSTNTIKVHQVA